ncbi:MAG: hypothetical protein HY755_05080 [Nitrospirae bacterium]|nr:hypothetical protein [Nitrospirota bacterium]
MRTLIYVPVIHTSADFGSLAGDVTKRGIADLGEEVWREHQRTVEGLWDAVSDYFDSIDVSGMKIYQDGMVADGEVGQKIVEEGIKLGSKNYEIISRLIKKGAYLMKTEDIALVKRERDYLIKLTKARTNVEKLTAYLKYRLSKNHLLKKRDGFIANRINETLRHEETGIIFIGAYHNIIPMLDKDIQVKEIKNIEKIKNYQKAFFKGGKDRKRLEELSGYLISPIDN